MKAATNLIPFSCMLKNFFQHEDIVLPAAFLFHWGRGMSLRVQMIQDLIKKPLYYPSTSNERNEQTESENTSEKKWKQNWLWVFFSSCHFFWSKEPKAEYFAQKKTLGR